MNCRFWKRSLGTILSRSAVATLALLLAGQETRATGLVDNVPEAAGYALVYEFPIPVNSQGWAAQPVPYSIDNAAAIADGSFDRVAYYLEAVKTTGETQWIYVSMSTYTTNAARLGVPRNYVVRNGLYDTATPSNATVRSNVGGITVGDGIDTINLEFWPSNYGTGNDYGVPGADINTFDFGDGGASASAGHGSMQIHNYGASQTLFAYNNWGSSQSACALGIGNQSTGNPDWTFNTANISTYSSRTLQVLARVFSLENLPLTNVTATSACMNAHMTCFNEAYDLWAYWGETDQTTNAGQWAHSAWVGNYTNGIFDVTYPVTGLSGGVTNWCTFMASNSVRSVWATPSTNFVTCTQPAVDNGAGAEVSQGQALLRGNLTAGGTADIYLYWGRADGGQSRSYENVVRLSDVREGGFSTEVAVGYGFSYYYICLASNETGMAWATAATAFAMSDPVSGLVYADGLRGSVFQPTVDTQVPVDLGGAVYSNSFTRVFTGGKAGTILATNEVSSRNVIQTGAVNSWDDFVGSPGDHFVAALSGRFYPPVSGTYAFRWSQDDRGWMFMDLGDDGVFDAGDAVGSWAWNSSGMCNLTAGKGYNFMFFSQEFGGYDNLAFWYTPPGGSEAYVNPSAQPGQWRYATGTKSIGLANAEASDVGTDTATLNAELSGEGWGFDVYVCWGRSDGGHVAGNWETNAFVGTYYDWDGTVSLPVAGLTAGAQYYYTFFVTNDLTNAWAATSATFVTGGVTVQASDDEATEGTGDGGLFRVTRPETATNASLTVYYSLSGTAVNGQDYTALSGSVVIPAGEVSADIALEPLEDNDWSEGDESVSLVLAPGGYTVGTVDPVVVTLHDSGSPTQWTHHVPLIFSGYSLSETLINFSALVVLGTNVSGFSYGDLLSGQHDDLRFTDATMTQALNYEVENWDVDGLSQVWVQVPALTNGTTIWIHWGRSGVSAPPYTVNGATWSNGYAAVYHLAEDGVTAKDSSPYGNTMGVSNSVQQGTAGLVSPAARWSDGSNDWLQAPGNNSLQGMSKLTLQAWLYDEADDGQPRGLISKRVDSVTQKAYYFYKHTNHNLSFIVSSSGGEFANTTTSPNQWYFAAVTYERNVSSNRMKAYLDGTYRSARNDYSGDVPWTESALHVGILNANYGPSWKGLLDEVRISRATRSADWLQAEYLNMASNSVFQTCPGTSPSLSVEGYLQRYGAPDPAYGTTYLTAGQEVNCAAPAFVDLGDGLGYACEGYSLYTNLLLLARTGTGNSCVYTNSGGADRLVWHWKKQYRITFTNEGPGSVSPTYGWYDVGAQAVSLATSDSGCRFGGWEGDNLTAAQSSATALTVTVSRATGYTAHFLGERFDSFFWDNRMRISFGGYTRDETLADFPALVILTNNLAGCFRYGEMASPSDAGDLRFTAADGETELFYQVDTWNTNGLSYIWVCVPTLEPFSGHIFAYWGNENATEPPLYTQNGLAWPAAFRGVWHLNENATNGQTGAIHYDSTANGLNGVQTKNETAAGLIGNGQFLDGTNDWIDVSYQSALDMGSVFTWSGWVRFDRSAVDAFCRPISRKTVWNQTDGWELELTSGNDTRLTTHGGGSASVYALNFVPSWSNHAWYYVTVVYSNAVVQMYRDGVSQTVGGSLNPVVDNSLGLTFGNDVDHNEAKWQGVFDEYRIRTGAASADRIWAEYMNMASNGVFQTYSDSPRGTFFLLR